ncbi:Crp/Fnr family transcriptional regulator [Evansella cellulosilytica]|uniref:Transcriptional regulator, Crp/Fnr family n=1 Tax=Evansella cellulosilytica (strain ATCC 21833 / DSM 2522 / FERM P-1141 / JCM 9156 / N-4) TaxID=649639 RepID=E6TX78_EVAC2|nr:Crp/Fnr family transcriptional regulator [Evansella cellulosilytica]ADU31167.1 transcriptional regulator, Crp/Fnr family [Evansella cellulosilytica DSM 2522]
MKNNETLKEYTPFFDQLRDEDQHTLLLHGQEVFIRKGQILFYEGEEANHLYLIKSGQVRLSKMTIDQKMFFLHLKQKGDVFGEYCLFNDMSASMTSEVVQDATLIRFDKKDLEALFSQHGEIAVAFIKLFARNTQSTQAKFSDLLLYGKTGAFYSILIRFANSYGVSHPKGIRINKKLTNQDIAHFIGTSRETINRLLNDLKQDNIVYMERGYIVLTNINTLKNYVQCGKCPLEICTI